MFSHKPSTSTSKKWLWVIKKTCRTKKFSRKIGCNAIHFKWQTRCSCFALRVQVPHRRIISVLDIEFMTMAVDVLASIVFGLMALSNLQVSIHTWLFSNICPLSFLHHSTNIMIHHHLHPISSSATLIVRFTLVCYFDSLCSVHVRST